MKTTLSFLAVLICSLTSFSILSADDHEPVVPGYQRFKEVEDVPDHQKGTLLLNELNCTSCHAGESGWSIEPKQAPILSGIGNRLLPEFFESFVLDPHAAKPGTTMPNVLAGKTEQEKKQIAGSIGQFLASTGKTTHQSSNTALVNKGRKLYHAIGCVACHDPQNKDTHIATSVPLGDLEKKYSVAGLIKFIQNPQHTRPSSRMPQFKLYDQDAPAIASYLLRNVVIESKINFAYYEGTWDRIPDFDRLEPKDTGISGGFDVLVGKRKDNFAVVYSGFWQTTEKQTYKFRIGSDDGSKLIINGKTVVDNDGIHGVAFKESELELAAGIHEVRVEFFEKGGGEVLTVEISGGDYKSADLATLMRATKEEAATPNDAAYQYDAAMATTGKEHFQTLGCAKCHELKVGETLVSSDVGYSAKPLKELDTTKGCLAGAPNAPDFGLSKHQVQCLTSAINRIKDPKPGAVNLQTPVHEKFMTLNCYACHNRESELGIFGGVVDVTGDSDEVFGRKDWFGGNQAEMGDEGQHPPSLKSVGAKLKIDWLERVLENGNKSRPYMKTRMPKFGGKNVYGELVNELVAADKLQNVPVVTQTESMKDLKKHGRFLAGEEALSCIKCHTFGTFNATGIQAISLTTMKNRLNKDWFHVYMLKPSKFRRGTRMPESWPGGKTFYPDMLDGDTDKQIDALWAYLSDGPSAPKPKGLLIGKNELRATKTPVIYRNFIEGAGPRAIGVGYPELANLAFDAQDCRMALMWQENFIDASRHWTARGQGFEPPLGENVLSLPDSIVFANDFAGDQWPTDWADDKRPKFKGYRFDENRRPVFMYTVGDVTIEDHPIPFVIDDRPLLNRKFKFKSSGSKSLSYLVAVGDKIEINDDITSGNPNDYIVSVDGKLKMQITNATSIKVIKRDEKSAAVATFDLSSGSATSKQSYDW